jgi:HSP20 family protein
MSNLSRWEPVREMMTLREAMDRLFDDAFTRPLGATDVSVAPAVDLYETDNEVVVKANLPGLTSDDVHISITSDVLTLSGELKFEDDRKGTTYHVQERCSGAFERSVMLPTDVEADKAKAVFEDGVLVVTLPKAETVKPKVITIKAK